MLREVVNKTDGVPLFVEELVMESGLLRQRDGHYELTSPLRNGSHSPHVTAPEDLAALLQKIASERT